MDYRFGTNKPNFTGTVSDWNKLKKQIAWWNEDSSNYPNVIVICPHCGAKNTHNIEDQTYSHYACKLMIDRRGKVLVYDCPGYGICRYINTPM